MRLKCTISYDGHLFNGYQVQPGKRTVQDELEKALAVLHKSKDRIPVVSSGRTDSGVHAAGQVIHFDTPLSIPAERWPYALNALLPDDIAVKQAEIADDGFHARFSAVKKNIATLYTRRNTRTYLNGITLTIFHIALMCRT